MAAEAGGGARLQPVAMLGGLPAGGAALLHVTAGARPGAQEELRYDVPRTRLRSAAPCLRCARFLKI